jgi:hypothetical protein
VDEISEAGDIQLLVRDYLESLALPATQLASIVTFFQAAKMAAKTKLTTGPSECLNLVQKLYSVLLKMKFFSYCKFFQIISLDTPNFLHYLPFYFPLSL